MRVLISGAIKQSLEFAKYLYHSLISKNYPKGQMARGLDKDNLDWFDSEFIFTIFDLAI